MDYLTYSHFFLAKAIAPVPSTVIHIFGVLGGIFFSRQRASDVSGFFVVAGLMLLLQYPSLFLQYFPG